MKVTIIADLGWIGVRAHVVDVEKFDPVKYLRDHPKVLAVQTEAWDDAAAEYVMTTPLRRDQVNPEYL